MTAAPKRVLIVDLDPQGNTTSAYGVSKNKLDADVYTCLIDDDDVRSAIVKTEYNADLLPSNTQLAGAAVELVNSGEPPDTMATHEQVEAVIEQLTDVALEALDRADIDDDARGVLRSLATAVTRRTV